MITTAAPAWVRRSDQAVTAWTVTATAVADRSPWHRTRPVDRGVEPWLPTTWI